MSNQQRQEALKKLSPLEAVQTWIDGDFGLDDESALCEAIRKDPRVTLSDDDISEIIFEAILTDGDAAACLERLAAGP